MTSDARLCGELRGLPVTRLNVACSLQFHRWLQWFMNQRINTHFLVFVQGSHLDVPAVLQSQEVLGCIGKGNG